MFAIGNRLADLRKAKGLTQSELAEKLNVNFRTIGNWENGTHTKDITLEKLLKLCEIFDCGLDHLVGNDEYVSSLDKTMGNELGLHPKAIENIKSNRLSTSQIMLDYLYAFQPNKISRFFFFLREVIDNYGLSLATAEELECTEEEFFNLQYKYETDSRSNFVELLDILQDIKKSINYEEYFRYTDLMYIMQGTNNIDMYNLPPEKAREELEKLYPPNK